MNKPEMIVEAGTTNMDRELLVGELRTLIINAINLHHLKPEDIKAETPFGPDGLNLDSVDILEVVVSVEQKYRIKVKDADSGRKYFGSLGGIADFILQPRS